MEKQREEKQKSVSRLLKSLDVSRSELESLIDEWVLSERDRQLMKRRLIDSICCEPLAEEFNLSSKRVQQIVKKHCLTLYKKLKH